LIDPSTSAHHMIEHARVVIVAPFSSPAIIAESFGKPVVFFDPTNTIQLDDNAAAGIPIVSTVEELKAFIKTSLNNINQ
ncbi:MAG: polysaccharide biosynthesis PFTS motif protein, partial [Candidatus Puniceispirillales bacterium WSBS_2018_MAG_OTU23]